MVKSNGASVTRAHELKAWYKNLPDRNRLALNILLIFISGMVLLFALLRPSYHFYQNQQQNFSEQQDLVSWLQANRQAFNQIAGEQPEKRFDKTNLVSWLNALAKEQGVSLRRIEPGEQGARVWVDSVQTDQLVRFVAEMETQGAHLEQLSITQRDKPGYVSTSFQVQ